MQNKEEEGEGKGTNDVLTEYYSSSEVLPTNDGTKLGINNKWSSHTIVLQVVKLSTPLIWGNIKK